MGSFRFGGVIFQVYSDDHLPRHVHARYAGISVIVELRSKEALVAKRRNAIDPPDAKRSHVAHVLRAANAGLSALHELWEETHDGA